MSISFSDKGAEKALYEELIEFAENKIGESTSSIVKKALRFYLDSKNELHNGQIRVTKVNESIDNSRKENKASKLFNNMFDD